MCIRDSCCLLLCTSGVVTGVSIQCAHKPKSIQVAFLACASFEQVIRVLATARQHLGEILSACEFLDADSMANVTTYVEGVKNPLSAAEAGEHGGPFYMLVETSGSHAGHDAEKLETFLQVRFYCMFSTQHSCLNLQSIPEGVMCLSHLHFANARQSAIKNVCQMSMHCNPGSTIELFMHVVMHARQDMLT